MYDYSQWGQEWQWGKPPYATEGIDVDDEFYQSLLDRPRYFEEIPNTGDLFLDPDTGIATGRVKDRKQYILPYEIRTLLDVSGDRLLAVYQHVRGQKVSGRVDACLSRLGREIDGFGWCSYESGSETWWGSETRSSMRSGCSSRSLSLCSPLLPSSRRC